MNRQWIRLLATLLFCSKLSGGAVRVEKSKERLRVELNCQPPEVMATTVWFRVMDKSGIEFLATFSTSGMVKSQSNSFTSIFSDIKIRDNVLTITSFNKGRDSGIYSCASMKDNKLYFGDITRLVGDDAAPPPVTYNPSATTKPCSCENATMQDEFLLCNSVILIPLAGSCGLLLLLILIIIVYCNRMRTRRCPHHYKKRPLKKMAPGKQQPQQQHTLYTSVNVQTC
ncbi:T-cell surface glycoprotein CD8 alpha chain [Hippocampus zosterae]|uniref:T-cell surface glycoprotein CD8 alpha chain n=1 Tax=Hippocampus zosterae TaxID=109293 RepID=UPI00223CCCEE|nr:T-cell surface glycoprotein CD8 alpha chain [Hippocampus zosterae]